MCCVFCSAVSLSLRVAVATATPVSGACLGEILSMTYRKGSLLDD